MILPARILLKDLVELAQSRVLLLLVLIVPILLVLLIGNIRVKEPVLRVAIHTGVAAVSDPNVERAHHDELRGLLDELSNVTVSEWTEDTPDLLERARRERIDLLANWEEGWRFYTPQTHPYRLQYIATIAQNIVVSLERTRVSKKMLGDLHGIRLLVEQRPVAEPGGEGDIQATDDIRVLSTIQQMKQDVEKAMAVPVPMLSAALSAEVKRYFPALSDADRSAVPGLIALVSVFTPFLLASGAFVRERETGMLEIVVLAGRRKWSALVGGKLLLPIIIAAVSLLLQLLVARSFFGFGFKPGMAGLLLLQFLAMLASGILGLSVSALVRSQQQAYLVSAVYLLGLILFTGYVYPLEQASTIVRFASNILPLTFSGPALEGWLLQGAGLSHYVAEATWLAALFCAAAMVCAVSLRRLERSL